MAEVEPTRYKGVPLRVENQVDFYRDFAPAVREYGLENAVKAVIDISEGYGVYEDLRKNAGQNDLEIIQRYVDLPKIDLPIKSIRQEGIAEDDVVNIFLEDLGLNKKTDLLDKGIDPKEFLQAFVKGRTLTDMEAIKEGGIRGARSRHAYRTNTQRPWQSRFRGIEGDHRGRYWYGRSQSILEGG
jgi:hypothetical protein